MSEDKMVPGPITWKNYAQWEWKGKSIKELSRDDLIVALTETLETVAAYRKWDFDRHEAFGKLLEARCRELREDIEALVPSREQQADNLEALIERAAYKS